MKLNLLWGVVALFITSCTTSSQSTDNHTSETKTDSIQSMNTDKLPASIFDFTMTSLEGKEISLADFKGKKLLLVNVASECGYTPQYKDLQQIHEQYGENIQILAFPANNFGGQEPGTNEEIAAFCEKNYGVTFPVFSKIDVVGKNQHPLYRWLSTKAGNGWNEQAPEWNFCKYLLDEEGKLLSFYPASVNPAEIILELEEEEIN